MKRSGLLLAFVLVGIGFFLAFAQPAHAANFTCNEGGNAPTGPVSGDAIITEPGSCTLSIDVQATGRIIITAGGAVNVQNLSAGAAGVTINTSSGSITAGTISAPDSNVNIFAPTNVTVNNVTTTSGGISITAQGGTLNAGNLQTSGPNFGGSVTLTAQKTITVGDIDTHGPVAQGGSVTIRNTSEDATIGSINSSSGTGSNNGGNIGIDVVRVLQVTGDIDSGATGSGNGGSVNIISRTDSITTQNIKTSSANGSAAGLITIQNTGTNKTIQTGSLESTTPPSVVATTGHIVVKPGSGVTIQGNISSGGYIEIRTPFTPASGGPNTIDVQGTLTAKNSNIVLLAGNNIKTQSITIDNSTALACAGGNAGQLDIEANLGAGHTATTQTFVIGAASNNGVNGNIVTDTVNGGCNEEFFTHGGIYVLNEGTGGITITSGSNLSVVATASKAGFIGLDADRGVLTLPSGTISADGTGSNSAGVLAFRAERIVANGTTLTASNTGTPGPNHFITLAATQVDTGAGLTVRANGNGTNTNVINAQVMPRDGMTITSSQNPTNLTIFVNYPNGLEFTQAPLTFNVTGPLQIIANGDHAYAAITGYPVVFNGSAPVTIQSRGNVDHQAFISYRGPTTGVVGVQFGAGQVTLDTDGVDGGTGGNATIHADNIAFSTGRVFMHSNGDQSGAGGNVLVEDVSTSSVTPLVIGNQQGQMRFQANGGITGNGGSVKVTAVLRPITANGPQIDVLAGADGASNANGGKIELTTGGNITLNGNLRANAVGTGNAGSITLKSGANLVFAGGPDGANKLIANGNGVIGIENIHVEAAGDITLGLTANSVDLTARALASNGQGGFIKVLSTAGTITANGANATVTAGDTGNGGRIELHAAGSITVNGNLRANGGTTSGNGGSVVISGGPVLVDTNAVIAVSADGTTGSRIAGTVTVTSDDAVTVRGRISANGQSDGPNRVITIDAVGQILIDGGAITAKGGDAVAGGTIQLTSGDTSEFGGVRILAPGPDDRGTLNANGGPSGGTITITSAGEVHIVGVATSSASGPVVGDGGVVTINAQSTVNILGAVRSNGFGLGSGNQINITGARVQIASGKVLANGGDAGDGGDIIITTTDPQQALTITGVEAHVFANGGAGDNPVVGNGGTVTLNGAGDVSILQGGRVRASSTASIGDGGTVTVNSGQVADASINIVGQGSQIVAEPGLDLGNGGHVTLSYSDVAGSKRISVAFGIVVVDRPIQGTGLGGDITLINRANQSLKVENSGHISADGGTINLNQPGQTVLATYLDEPGRYTGTIVAEGTSCTIQAIRALRFGNVTCTDSISIQVVLGTGDIRTVAGAVLKAPVVNLSVDQGDIGTAAAPVATNTNFLKFTTSVGLSGSRRTFISNVADEGDLTISVDSVPGGTTDIRSNGGIKVPTLITQGGDLTITADTGVLEVLAESTVTAIQGNLKIRNLDTNNGRIELNGSVTLSATGVTSGTGNIRVLIGAVESGNYLPHPAQVPNVLILQSPPPEDVQLVFIGENSIAADGNNNVISATNRQIYVDTNIRPASAIHLNGDVSIIAVGN